MFKREKTAGFTTRKLTVREPIDTLHWTAWQKFTSRRTSPRDLHYYRFRADKLVCDREYSQDEYSLLVHQQQHTPITLMVIGEKKWWWFRHAWYIEDEGLGAAQVKALVIAAEEKRKRRLDRAVTIAAIAERPTVDGVPISDSAVSWVGLPE